MTHAVPIWNLLNLPWDSNHFVLVSSLDDFLPQTISLSPERQVSTSQFGAAPSLLASLWTAHISKRGHVVQHLRLRGHTTLSVPFPFGSEQSGSAFPFNNGQRLKNRVSSVAADQGVKKGVDLRASPFQLPGARDVGCKRFLALLPVVCSQGGHPTLTSRQRWFQVPGRVRLPLRHAQRVCRGCLISATLWNSSLHQKPRGRNLGLDSAS